MITFLTERILLCIEHGQDDDRSEEVDDGVGDHHVFTACEYQIIRPSAQAWSPEVSSLKGMLHQADWSRVLPSYTR